MLGLKDATQMTVADTEPRGHASDAGRIPAGRLCIEGVGGLGRERSRRVHHRPGQAGTGGDFGSALHAGAKRRGLGLRRRLEKTAVLLQRRANAADRAAVDAGRSDTHEEPAVETRVACGEHLIRGGVVEWGRGLHERDYRDRAIRDSPFSDTWPELATHRDGGRRVARLPLGQVPLRQAGAAAVGHTTRREGALESVQKSTRTPAFSARPGSGASPRTVSIVEAL